MKLRDGLGVAKVKEAHDREQSIGNFSGLQVPHDTRAPPLYCNLSYLEETGHRGQWSG